LGLSGRNLNAIKSLDHFQPTILSVIRILAGNSGTSTAFSPLSLGLPRTQPGRDTNPHLLPTNRFACAQPLHLPQ